MHINGTEQNHILSTRANALPSSNKLSVTSQYHVWKSSPVRGFGQQPHLCLQGPVEQLVSSPHQIPFPSASFPCAPLLLLTLASLPQVENSSAGDWRTPQPAEILLNHLSKSSQQLPPKPRPSSTSTGAQGQLKKPCKGSPACYAKYQHTPTQNTHKCLGNEHHLCKISSRVL